MTAVRKPRQAKPPPTYENEVLSVLAYEFPFSDRKVSETKIKRRLQRKKLGPYDAERIASMRRLKDELQETIHQGEKSEYFNGFHGKYADMQDFDMLRMIADMIAKYPQIPSAEIESFVPFCVAIYHLL